MDVMPGGWELAVLFSKWCLYFGIASLAGGSLCLWQFSDGRRSTVGQLLNYIMLGTLVGFQAVIVSFLAQVGQLNGAGVGGMFDWNMARLLLDTNLGDVTLLRLAAFVWALLATLLYLRQLAFSLKPFSQRFYARLALVYAAPVLMLAATFRLAGHASLLAVSGQLAVMLHVLAAAAWIGSLYPLLLLSRSSDQASLQVGMRRFGNLAAWVLVLLIGAGFVMSLQLLGAVSELVTTAYGRALLLKLAGVTVLLGIAGLNKFVHVPALEQAAGAGRLGRSIQWEMLAALLVLATTAYFSTQVGPLEHQG